MQTHSGYYWDFQHGFIVGPCGSHRCLADFCPAEAFELEDTESVVMDANFTDLEPWPEENS